MSCEICGATETDLTTTVVTRCAEHPLTPREDLLRLKRELAREAEVLRHTLGKLLVRADLCLDPSRSFAPARLRDDPDGKYAEQLLQACHVTAKVLSLAEEMKR